MGISTLVANKLVDHFTGKTAFTLPAFYVGLSSTTPTAAGANITEPSTGGYARVLVPGASWAAAAAGSTNNTVKVTFPTASADWAAGANMTHFVVFDAITAGNFNGFGALTTPKNCLNGDTLEFPISALTAVFA